MSQNPYFEKLFRPIQIGSKIYKNRIAATPLGNVSVWPDGGFPASAFALYESRAKGGCAEVAASETVVDFDYANRLRMSYVDYRDYGSPHHDGLKRYTEMLHSYGAIATIELNHCGLRRFASAGEKGVIGPSAWVRDDGVHVRQMDESLMEMTVENFAQLANYAKLAGYDGVLPHLASGWLLHQFFSPLTNHREDEYGGSVDNRARFPLRVLQAIRDRCGKDFLIIPRLCAEEGVPGGYGIDDCVQLCRKMTGLVDMIHVVRGVYYDPVLSGEFSSLYDPHNLNEEHTKRIKDAVDIPVMLAGGINSPEDAERILAEGKADLIGLGRQMLADPNWAAKAESGRAADITRCIRCFRCFPGPLQDNDGKLLTPPDKKCTVNPTADLNELEVPIQNWPKPEHSRRVLVVGGGIAGLTAAYTAADRGHNVTLVEKGDALGGLIRHADVDVHKVDMSRFKQLSIRRCEEKGVKLRLNTEITAENIRDYAPEAVILALGAEPVTPRIPGIENAYQALQVYFDPSLTGERVVMAGGGLVGCECALNLACQGRKVTLIEMRDALAVDDYKMHRVALLDQIARQGIDVRVNHRCVSFEADGVRCEDEHGKPVFLPADTIVFAMGLRANSEMADRLQEVLEPDIPVWRVGDCVRAAKVQNAVEEAYLAAMQIL